MLGTVSGSLKLDRGKLQGAEHLSSKTRAVGKHLKLIGELTILEGHSVY